MVGGRLLVVGGRGDGKHSSRERLPVPPGSAVSITCLGPPRGCQTWGKGPRVLGSSSLTPQRLAAMENGNEDRLEQCSIKGLLRAALKQCPGA